jgi:hypothetical protein
MNFEFMQQQYELQKKFNDEQYRLHAEFNKNNKGLFGMLYNFIKKLRR